MQEKQRKKASRGYLIPLKPLYLIILENPFHTPPEEQDQFFGYSFTG